MKLRLTLRSPEKAEHEKLIFGEGLKLTDEGFATAVQVHGGHEGEEGIGVGGDGGVLGGPLDTPPPEAIAGGLSVFVIIWNRQTCKTLWLSK